LKIRKESVAKYPGFFGKSYEPYSEVFGGLVDNLPWWGLEGIYFFGPGKHSMDGLSKESQFIVNPFLLGGLSEFQAFPTMKFTGREDISPPELKDIRWDAQTNSFVVKYDVRNNFRFKFRFNTPGQQEFTLMAYNDRDFGYNYLFMSIENSVNLESLNPIPGRILLRQQLGAGFSAECPGGSNNSFPEQMNMAIRVVKLPAKAQIHLWQSEPESNNSPPDARVLLEIE